MSTCTSGKLPWSNHASCLRRTFTHVPDMWASGGWEERLTSDNALLLLLLALLAACEGGEGGSSSWLCSTALVPSEPPRLNRNEFKAPCSCTHAGMARPDVSKGRAGKR